MSQSNSSHRSRALTKTTGSGDTTMARTRRSYSPSSRSRSSSAGPRDHHKKPGIKTAAVFIAAIAVASLAVHKLWPRGIIHSEKEHWEHSSSPGGRRSRRRNAIRDRHNGYIDYDDHNVWDRNDHPRDRRRLPERDYYPPRSRGGGRSRGYGSESEGDSYYSDDYLPSPSERRGRLEGDGRGRSRGIGAEGENEMVRYEKQSNRSEAAGSRFVEERLPRPRYNEAVEDWSRRGGQRFPSPPGEPEYVDRKSRRRSNY
ncbi:hypothetical protein BDP81DRAFT_54124 [Colletotrichum phormii]|uniref:Uncharacterized protein n=1 Tax=Colletotrichum phormii TaxID=359342 RepID=A0AAI9ZMS8_9PEZI|nr:uncharacterized protein BDP81DRAFT_54124 [Colletotrichum phormii]KAK1634876.1 hypothetical protein BDP81DRAFT_54124 [Colletotrichum phormii]